MPVRSAQGRTEQRNPAAGYPPRDRKFLALNLAIRLLPIGWKYWGNSILLKTSIIDSGPISLPEGYKWTWAGPEDIDDLDRHPEATSSTAYARRAARGDRCLCIKQGDEIVGYRWYKLGTGCVLCGFGENMEITLFPLKPDQAFAYDLFTYRKYRGQGVATMLNKLLCHALRMEGIKEVLVLVSLANHAAIRLNLRLGAKPLRLVYCYRIRNWSKVFLGPEEDTRLSEWTQQFMPSSRLEMS